MLNRWLSLLAIATGISLLLAAELDKLPASWHVPIVVASVVLLAVSQSVQKVLKGDSSMPKWLHVLAEVGPTVLKFTPLAPIAPLVIAAIGEAEAMGGKSGPEKLAHVVNIATEAAQAAQAQGVNIDPVLVQSAAIKAISTAVDVTNMVQQAQKPAA